MRLLIVMSDNFYKIIKFEDYVEKYLYRYWEDIINRIINNKYETAIIWSNKKINNYRKLKKKIKEENNFDKSIFYKHIRLKSIRKTADIWYNKISYLLSQYEINNIYLSFRVISIMNGGKNYDIKYYKYDDIGEQYKKDNNSEHKYNIIQVILYKK